MSKLTVKELDALTSANIGQTIHDDGGLRGKVRTNGKSKNGVSVTFVFRYKWNTKTKDFSCGTWPSESIAKIRAKRDSAKACIAVGIDPSAQKKIAKQEEHEAIVARLAEIKRQESEALTVQDLFDAWLKDGVRRKDGNSELQRSFKADALPKIGKMPIKDVTEHDLRSVLRVMVGRGVNRAAVVMRNNLTQMFSWAEKRQPWRKLLADGNPMELIEIEKIVSPNYDLNNQRDRILSDVEICELRAKFQRMQADYDTAPNKRIALQPVEQTVQCAIWIMLSTLCRVGELSMARWEHVNFDAKEWFIPKENVKGNSDDLTVYLSEFALDQFRQLQKYTGESKWCFPARMKEGHVCVKSISKQIGDRQSIFKKGKDGKPRMPMAHRRHDNTLVLGNGKNCAWTPHDLRRTGATLMQSLGVSLDIIDRCQNHVLHGSKVRRHYLHHDYAQEKREAWRLLGERLSMILDAANVIPFQRKA